MGGSVNSLFPPPELPHYEREPLWEPTVEREPVLPTEPFEVRDYQEQARENWHAVTEEVNGAAVILPTGCGKSLTGAKICNDVLDKGGRILNIIHTEELVYQQRDTLLAVIGIMPSIEMADLRSDEYGPPDDRPRIVVGTIQTISRRLEKFDPDTFTLVWIDEFHHAAASTYKKTIKYFKSNPNIKFLLTSATPDRADRKNLSHVCDDIAMNYEVSDAINDGWLVPVVRQGVVVEGLDYSTVRTVGLDLSKTDLQKILQANENVYGMVDPIINLTGEQRTIVFTVSVDHAELLAATINQRKPDSAAALSAKTPKEDRRAILDRFKAGEIQYLCNVAILTEGVDVPGIEIVAMCRPTKSRAVYAQQLGRAFRPLPGILRGLETPEERRFAIATSGKPKMLVLDFVGNTGAHKLVTATNFLGTDYTPEEIALAEELSNAEAMPVKKALKQAREELQAQMHANVDLAKYRREVLAKALYTVGPVIDIFDQWQIEARPASVWNRDRRPTPKMLKVLENAGIIRGKRSKINERDLSFDAARQLIDEIMRRKDADQLSPKQISLLERFGYGTDYTRSQVAKIVNAIAADHWIKRGPGRYTPRQNALLRDGV
jgi:superfamily II DNA or RNA helicase